MVLQYKRRVRSILAEMVKPDILLNVEYNGEYEKIIDERKDS